MKQNKPTQMQYERDVFDHINSRYFKMTKSERRVAEYVMAHRTEPKFMSITELATTCGVAEATVSRFCKNLGLKGYSAFKLELAKANAASSFGTPEVDEQNVDITVDDTIAVMCQKLYSVNVAALKQTLEFVEEANIRSAVDLIEKADHVYCMGQGGSMVLAEEAYSLFLTVTPKFHIVHDSHLQMITTALLSDKDLILFFSYSGATKHLLELMQVVQQRQTKIVLISRFPQSPGAEHANVVLKCGSNESPLRSGSVAARISQLFIIDMLYTEMLRRNGAAFAENQLNTADALTCKLL